MFLLDLSAGKISRHQAVLKPVFLKPVFLKLVFLKLVFLKLAWKTIQICVQAVLPGRDCAQPSGNTGEIKHLDRSDLGLER